MEEINKIIYTNGNNEKLYKHFIESCCQELVESGKAYWINSSERTPELHLNTGEVFMLLEEGITRIK
ncbi:Uncharacterised protein [Pseudomonas luteola]|uniref:Uncharacterized protein n=1 Tax=Pseudomonas luteola TaxID=47886 RepID=A0A2X2CY68_PSELU|nr:hypothetical protein [Pseudomonas luteola]SPZ04865.1 Uncharacterised protein [Pseudomonas luteola]